MPRHHAPPPARKRSGKDSADRPSRAGIVLFWLAVPVVIALGSGVGYVASEAWLSPDRTTSTVANPDPHSEHAGHEGHLGHEGHGAPAAEPAPEEESEEDAEPENDAASGDVASGHEASGHSASGHEASGHSASAPVARPRAAVFATFAAVNVAILIAAALLRRNRNPRPARRVTARTV